MARARTTDTRSSGCACRNLCPQSSPVPSVPSMRLPPFCTVHGAFSGSGCQLPRVADRRLGGSEAARARGWGGEDAGRAPAARALARPRCERGGDGPRCERGGDEPRRQSQTQREMRPCTLRRGEREAGPRPRRLPAR
jgi:hypothetical protein